MKKVITLCCLCAFNYAALTAQVKMVPVFSDNMVLQQQSDAPIWGEAKPGKNVSVSTSWDKATYTAVADDAGKWAVKVKTPKAGGPYEITVSDGKPIKLSNVLIGEVWICSGQSNMEMQVEGWGKVKNYEQEKVEADSYPNIRLLKVEKEINPRPQTDFNAVGGGWMVCSANTVANFSAAGYFFGRDIHKYQNVPVGLIDVSWGGTIIEAWTSGEALYTMPDMVKHVDEVRSIKGTKADWAKKTDDDIRDWNEKLDKVDAGVDSSSGNHIWAAKDFDDSSWKDAKVPGNIESVYPDYDGVVWYRKVVDIPSSWAGKELTINLGAIDDDETTYFNGIEIGSNVMSNSNRQYKIPKNLVKKGKAVIAVRLVDTGGPGGFSGLDNAFYLEYKGKRLSIAGDWKCMASVTVKDIPPVPTSMLSNPNRASVLYNAMLKPLIPYSIKGAVWYQGESNSDKAYQYRELMPLMITDWRNKWGYEFPFYMVQLANYTALQTEPVESDWAELREAQAKTLNLRNTGMAVTIDIGEAGDIHPKNKQEVGRRLALAARATAYGENIVYKGPMYKTYRIEGNKIRIFFDNDGELKTSDNGAVKGFTVAGLDHKFHWAKATIEGNTVVVSCDEVDFPVAVRYAWAENPVCNLFNSYGLPASPFRTDDWQGKTYGNKF